MRDLPFLERAKQRSALYIGRTSRSAIGGITSPCVYMHVPKCGGTSVAEALYATVPLHKRIGIVGSKSLRRALAMYHTGKDDFVTFHDEGDRAEDIAAFREKLVMMYMADRAALIHGHFLFTDNIARFAGDDYKFISILRDPIARTVSNYRMANRNGIYAGDFDSFLDSSMAWRMSRHMLRFFGGRSEIAAEEVPAMVEKAKANMGRFALIGFADDMQTFEKRFAQIFGARPRVGQYNVGRGDGLKITPQQKARLEVLCAPDIELFEYARGMGRHPARQEVAV